MATNAIAAPAPVAVAGRASRGPARARAVATLARRRAALTARTPRQIAVPLLGPIMLALVLAPALSKALGGLRSHIDYSAYVAIGAVGLLVPISCVFAGLSVIVDRNSGAQRELLAAPVPRALLVLGNLGVALVLAALQVAVLLPLAALRGAQFHVTATGMLWFVAAAVPFAVVMYGVAELLASRMNTEEDYAGAIPIVAILPFFFGGALFPIAVLPGALATVAKFLPITHALALMRYGLLDPRGAGLHDIWGPGNTTTEAWLSLAVVVLFAIALVALAIRSFARRAVS
jgi:ABC-2 type transport system permease protein